MRLSEKPRFVWAGDRYHTPDVFVPDYVGVGDNADNWFGRVVAVYEDGKTLGVNCQHGGSMWLCKGCAEAVMRAAGPSGAEKTP